MTSGDLCTPFSARIFKMNQTSSSILMNFLFWVVLPYASGTILSNYIYLIPDFSSHGKSYPLAECILEISNSASLQNIIFAMLSPLLTVPDYAHIPGFLC